ncbi:hypothetical protein [Streptomyces nigrescens]
MAERLTGGRTREGDAVRERDPAVRRAVLYAPEQHRAPASEVEAGANTATVSGDSGDDTITGTPSGDAGDDSITLTGGDGGMGGYGGSAHEEGCRSEGGDGGDGASGNDISGTVDAHAGRHGLAHGWFTGKGTTHIVAITDAGRAVLRERLGLGNAALEVSGSEPSCSSRPSRGKS